MLLVVLMVIMLVVMTVKVVAMLVVMANDAGSNHDSDAVDSHYSDDDGDSDDEIVMW